MNEYHARHRYMLVAGHRLAYLDEGNGPPVLLIHGIPTSSLLWRSIVPVLAETHRVIAPDRDRTGLIGRLPDERQRETWTTTRRETWTRVHVPRSHRRVGSCNHTTPSAELIRTTARQSRVGVQDLILIAWPGLFSKRREEVN